MEQDGPSRTSGPGPGRRATATILHLDLDAFFAAVEQRDKPSLRGQPVIVGGLGGRGVVATASYEARAFGIRSAMSTAEARKRAPNAAYLTGRHPVYRAVSELVMEQLRLVSSLVEPLSLDEAFVDLSAADLPDHDLTTLTSAAEELRAAVAEATGGLTASVGLGTSKLVAKIASDLRKPDALVVVAPGTEIELLGPLSVTRIPGVGPATAERLQRLGVRTIAQLAQLPVEELTHLLGDAHGRNLHALSRAEDPRPVVAHREAKSVSVENTYDTDLVDRRLLEALITRQAARVAAQLGTAGLSGRTVTVKVRRYDFSTHTRSFTLGAPVNDAAAIGTVALRLLGELETAGGVRLLGVGVSALTDWVQQDLFATEPLAPPVETFMDSPLADDTDTRTVADPRATDAAVKALITRGEWRPGMDVVHAQHGPGWVWGSGSGRVTVRFETADSGAGPVRTFRTDDPALTPA